MWCRFKAVYKHNSQIVLLRYRLLPCHGAARFVSREIEATTAVSWIGCTSKAKGCCGREKEEEIIIEEDEDKEVVVVVG